MHTQDAIIRDINQHARNPGQLQLPKPAMSDLRQTAEQRHAIHASHKTHRPLSDDYELVGLAGEAQFAKEFRCTLDTELRPAGDHGHDFLMNTDTGHIVTVDIKTARKPYNLLLEARARHTAFIYVLAHYIDEHHVKLLGWTTGRIMRSCPIKDFGYGIHNHYLPAAQLRPMRSLHHLLTTQNTHHPQAPSTRIADVLTG